MLGFLQKGKMNTAGHCKYRLNCIQCMDYLLNRRTYACFWNQSALAIYVSRIKPRLQDPSFKPQSSHIVATLNSFLDLLRIRYSSPLFRLDTAKAIQVRMTTLLLFFTIFSALLWKYSFSVNLLQCGEMSQRPKEEMTSLFFLGKFRTECGFITQAPHQSLEPSSWALKMVTKASQVYLRSIQCK